MKFIVSSSSLLKQLQHIAGVINANTVLPILEDFLFEVEKNKLTVVATDLETVMRYNWLIEAKDSGKVCHSFKDPAGFIEKYSRPAAYFQY
jgi:DNA polymerase-3 subunit beta